MDMHLRCWRRRRCVEEKKKIMCGGRIKEREKDKATLEKKRKRKKNQKGKSNTVTSYGHDISKGSFDIFFFQKLDHLLFF